MTVVAPSSLTEALDVLASAPDAQVLAGGTDFMVEVNDGRRRPSVVVSTRAVADLRGWAEEGDRIRIGAGVTYRDVMTGRLAGLLPALAQAARTVGSPPIRNAGTIGGNLATASPAGDTLPVLAALDAEVEVASKAGTRRLALGDFIVGPKRTGLRPGELVVAVRVRRCAQGQEYLKVGVRNAMVIAVASLAMALDGGEQKVRIAMGSVGPGPLRAPAAEEWLSAAVDWTAPALRDRTPAAMGETLARTAQLVRAAARPIDDHRATARYRTHAVGVLAERAARRLLLPEGRPA